MAIRVNYTQRGFRDKAEYDKFGGRTDDRDFIPDRLVFTTVKCKNPACLKADADNYSIEHVEGRDLEANPIICECGGKNVSIEYFKPHILPLIFIDDNHRNAEMYNEYFNGVRKGEIHPKFSDDLEIYKHPDYYYGADGHASYVSRLDPMMDGSIIDDDGNPVTWESYPWVDIMVDREGIIKGDVADPAIEVHIQPAIEEFLSEAFRLDPTNHYKSPANVADKNYTTAKTLVDLYPTWVYKIPDPANALQTNPSSTNQFFSIVLKAGSMWNYNTAFTAEQKKEINAWEAKSPANVYPRKGKMYPPTDTIFHSKISEYDYSQKRDKIAMFKSGTTPWYEGVDAVDFPIYTQYDEDKEDPYQTTGSEMLPNVPEELKHPLWFPPLPLYRDSISGAGSTVGEYPTNKSATEIQELITRWPWIEDDGLITDRIEEEGTLFVPFEIPGYNHIRKETLSAESPFIIRNHHMYSSVLYIIRQVDMDDPIYEP